MKNGFSLLECMIYVLCLTLVFGLLGEMVFRFYLHINKELKIVQQFISSTVCLNNLVCDLFQVMSSEAVKKEEFNKIMIKMKDGEVVWDLRDDRLYRFFKRFNVGANAHKTASLMMRNVLDLDIVKYLNEKNSLAGFKIILKLNNLSKNFEHHVAVRGF